MGCRSNRDVFMPIYVGEMVKSIIDDAYRSAGCVVDEESSIRRADLGCLVDAGSGGSGV